MSEILFYIVASGVGCSIMERHSDVFVDDVWQIFRQFRGGSKKTSWRVTSSRPHETTGPPTTTQHQAATTREASNATQEARPDRGCGRQGRRNGSLNVQQEEGVLIPGGSISLGDYCYQTLEHDTACLAINRCAS